MIKISDDNINLVNVNQTSVVEKVLPVQKISSIRDLPSHHDEIDSEKLVEVVRELNEHVQAVQRELHFSVDEDTGQTVIKVTDLATNEVIRQIPNEEALNFARKLNEGADLKLFNEYT